MIALATLCVGAFFTSGALAASPEINGVKVSAVTPTSVTFEAEVNPQGKPTRWHFEYGAADCVTATCTNAPQPEGAIPTGSSPVHIEVAVEGLTPGGLYHYRLVTKNGDGPSMGSDHVFATRGTPLEGPPDGRAYEQSSEVDKDGGDATGKAGLIKAAANGSGITFQSTFGIPGGKGAQALPTYLSTRGTGWSTQGLLPPPSFGERAQVLGWLPDFSETFANATKLGNPRKKALVSQSTTGGPARIVSAYTPNAEYSYVGASADASVVFFESQAALPPVEGEDSIETAIEGRSNLYAWDRASGRLSLAGVLNDARAPDKGALAGPYDWTRGTNARSLSQGGAARGYYLQGTHAITAGDIYFTEAGTGQLYLRQNPTQPQSDVVAGKCTKPADACTVHVSASKRGAPDPAGPQPAAFQVANADGSEVFFTSPEKLTDDANTGPEQPTPAIGMGSSTTGAIEDAAFIPGRAVGVAVDAKYAYWADPIAGTIGRAELANPTTSIDEAFIEPGSTECEIEAEDEAGEPITEKFSAPSSPRYVAVDAGHVYWTNTGPRNGNGEPIDGCGTVGRADIEGTPASAESEFITGASNPQGIAVNTTHVYWANAASDLNRRSIARAEANGEGIEQEFFPVDTNRTPYGIALNASHIYIAAEDALTSYLIRVTLAGTEFKIIGIGTAGIRGLAVDGLHVYWASQSEEAIGRADLALEPASKDNEFAKPTGSLNGLAADSSHLYWSVNGETPPSPGNDLYRYEPASDTLSDLTPDSTDKNGAEVQGVLGASEDGSHVYFAANAAFDDAEAATPGDCQTQGVRGPLRTLSGSCNVYLWNEGTISYVGRVGASGNESTAGALNWTGTPREIFSTAGYTPKSAFVSKDGETLLFRSSEKLTGYDSEGVSELYRYSASDGKLACVSCPPSGEAVGKGPGLETDIFPGPLSPAIGSVQMNQSRNLSADGNRAFFQTAEALVAEDTNGQAGCAGVGQKLTPACLDVYEWEAPNTGTCTTTAPGYSPLNEGCIYLISTGKSPFPSLFADASETGDDVFFFTREGLVGQDTDELQDVYDARVGGGLASQSPAPPNPCLSTESCHEGAPAAPSEQSAGSATFVGPGNQAQKHKKPKATKKKKQNKKPNHKKKGKKKQRANAKGRTGR